jgi:CspA family cold shock protein
MRHETGIIKWFNAARGYGFITGQSGEDIFVNVSAIQESASWVPQEAQQVEYAVLKGPRGVQAENVRRVVASPIA